MTCSGCSALHGKINRKMNQQISMHDSQKYVKRKQDIQNNWNIHHLMDIFYKLSLTVKMGIYSTIDIVLQRNKKCAVPLVKCCRALSGTFDLLMTQKHYSTSET